MEQNAPAQQTMTRVVLMGTDEANNLVPVKISSESGGFATSTTDSTAPQQFVSIYKPRLGGGTLSTGATTIYTAATAVVELKLYLTCITDVSVDLYHLPSGQSIGSDYLLLASYPMSAGETLMFPIPRIETGDALILQPSATPSLVWTLYGAEL